MGKGRDGACATREADRPTWAESAAVMEQEGKTYARQSTTHGWRATKLRDSGGRSCALHWMHKSICKFWAQHVLIRGQNRHFLAADRSWRMPQMLGACQGMESAL
mmetsp:Transcript_10292/g.63087  ORF Transcript_10292/g.63087 Transcript_10292/m.63087 type:complete len:105 (+) Transcript_10292:678-992(+)